MADITNASIPKESKILAVTTDILYDVLILGGGPAGLTAAVYIMRKGLSAALLTKNIGGQVIETAGIENYMGYRYIEGTDLIKKFFEQIKQFPIAFKEGIHATKLSKESGIFHVTCSDGETYRTKTLIIATGKSPRRLNVRGEKEFTGKGVAYCTICDAPLYAGLTTAVIGGGNSAIESAIDLCKICKEVHVIQLLPELTADKVLIRKLNEFNNFTIHYNCKLRAIKGDRLVTSIDVARNDSDEIFSLDVDGVFVAVGLIPNTDYLKGFLALNEFNEIVIDANCNTSVDGVFSAGDATSIRVKQIIVAAGEGAKAALASHQYLLGN